MNAPECDVLNTLLNNPYVNQRTLAENCGHALGAVNKALKTLAQNELLDASYTPTDKARALAARCAPRRAIILAAGFGMRMVPINTETPKGLLEVRGEPLIERQIRHLHEVGVTDITVVVGFMKESYEYLIDTCGVKLVVNADYAFKNNLHSLAKVIDRLSDCYIIPCDIWCADNPFSTHEMYSWYMVSNRTCRDSTVRINRQGKLIPTGKEENGNTMIGICYLAEAQAAAVRNTVRQLTADERYDDAFWEEALPCVQARTVEDDKVIEINTYEQLRTFDSDSNHLRSQALDVICKALHAAPKEIVDITVLKKGMTNRSFRFACREKKYIMRIPGEGTDQLINRAQEAAVYRQLEGRHICDDIVYIDPQNGYKITAFLDNARVCDPDDPDDLKKCMAKLRAFHEQALTVDHTFDIFGQMEFYETLWDGAPSAYRDYKTTKKQVLALKPYIEAHVEKRCLTHIDAVPDNFLFCPQPDGSEDIRLIDWEYAGMQDPHVDVAMFCIYSLYDRAQIDRLIDLYFEQACPRPTRIKIYAYIAACGLLWSNWCEYKKKLGVDFGEYSLRQYRFAKEYAAIVQQELGGDGDA